MDFYGDYTIFFETGLYFSGLHTLATIWSNRCKCIFFDKLLSLAGFEEKMSNNNLYVDGEEMFLWDIVLNVLTVK